MYFMTFLKILINRSSELIFVINPYYKYQKCLNFRFLESLLKFLYQQSEVLRAPIFRFRFEALYKFRTCSSIQSLARMILEIIGKNNKITLSMRLGEENEDFIAFCNKFIIGSGSERMELHSLIIQAYYRNMVLDSFSEVTLFLLSLIRLLQ